MSDRRTLCLTALLVALPACAGTETGNPPLTAELTVDAHSREPARVAIDADATEATVEEVWVSVGPVRFIGDDGCDAPDDVMAQIGSIGTEDHADGTAARAAFETTERSFCTVEIELAAAAAPLPAGAPPELEGATVVVLGHRPDDTPFIIVSTRTAPIAARAVSGRFPIEPGADGLFLGFDMATWLDGLDLAGATVGMDGRIVIDADDNPASSAAFESNLAPGVEIYRDQDRDAVPDEAAPLAIGE